MKVMHTNAETARIAEELRQVFSGKPWYGYPLSELLTGVSAKAAVIRPSPLLHSIWELVLHIELWARIGWEATHGVPMPKLYGTEKDWPAVEHASEEAWEGSKNQVAQTIEQFAQAIAQFGDERLTETVPGREYNFAYLFRGVVQHSVYHFGQIAMAKAALR